MALKIAAICVSAAIVCLAIRVNRPEIALAAALAAGTIACLLAVGELGATVELLKTMLNSSGMGEADSYLILRACGLSLIGEYAAQLCRDAGEGALAQRVEMGMRVSLLALCAPLAKDVLKMITELAP